MLGLVPSGLDGDVFRSPPPVLTSSSTAYQMYEMISPGGINLPTPEVASKDAASEAAAKRLQHRMNRLSAELSRQVQQYGDVTDKATPQPATEPASVSFKRWSDPKELVTRRVRARLAAAKPQEPPSRFELVLAEASPATCRDGMLPASPRCTLTPLERLPTPGCRSELPLDDADFEVAPRYRGQEACLAA